MRDKRSKMTFEERYGWEKGSQPSLKTLEGRQAARRRHAEKRGKFYQTKKEREQKANIKQEIKNQSRKIKTCKRCGENKSIIEFTSKYSHYCNECLPLQKRENIKNKIKWSMKKYHSDPKYRLNKRLKNSIGKCLRGEKDGKHWESLVGWRLEDLIKHLGKQLKKGMIWENYGSYWHIDHRIPLSRFNFSESTHFDFKRAWALKNLQPMKAKENISKGAKLNKPFQPGLKIQRYLETSSSLR